MECEDVYKRVCPGGGRNKTKTDHRIQMSESCLWPRLLHLESGWSLRQMFSTKHSAWRCQDADCMSRFDIPNSCYRKNDWKPKNPHWRCLSDLKPEVNRSFQRRWSTPGPEGDVTYVSVSWLQLYLQRHTLRPLTKCFTSRDEEWRWRLGVIKTEVLGHPSPHKLKNRWIDSVYGSHNRKKKDI